MRRIIAITGLIGSGKDTVAEHIAEKYGYEIIDYANILREICKEEGLELTRDNLQNLRLKYGNTFLAEEIVKRVKKSTSDKIVLTPLRRSEDFEIPQKEFGDIIMILVESDDRIRFERISKRGRENDPEDFEEFQRQAKRDADIYDFDKTFSYAKFKITNNGTTEDLKKEVDKVMEKLP